ncbi:MAG TPA: hypothetical protein VKB36_21940 [Vicinamibacterales bacterium]|nr:hypothetical protein [Vicinamibacterales bacterium]
MAEVLVRFTHPIRDGVDVYHAQACGAPMSDGRWTAWIEFISIDGRRPLRSPRETTQRNRIDAEYWATGLSPVYLDGALQRAQSPPVRNRTENVEPVFSEPAPDFADDDGPPPVDAVLDPVSAYQTGEWQLRQQLRYLSSWHLVKIIRAHGFSDEQDAVLKLLPPAALIERIVSGCQRLSDRL